MTDLYSDDGKTIETPNHFYKPYCPGCKKLVDNTARYWDAARDRANQHQATCASYARYLRENGVD